MECDNFVAVDLLQRRDTQAGVRYAWAIKKLIEEYMVSHQDGLFHRSRGDDGRLGNKRPDAKHPDQHHQQGAQGFPGAFASFFP